MATEEMGNMIEGQRLARREDFFSYYCLFRNVKKMEKEAFSAPWLYEYMCLEPREESGLEILS